MKINETISNLINQFVVFKYLLFTTSIVLDWRKYFPHPFHHFSLVLILTIWDLCQISTKNNWKISISRLKLASIGFRWTSPPPSSSSSSLRMARCLLPNIPLSHLLTAQRLFFGAGTASVMFHVSGRVSGRSVRPGATRWLDREAFVTFRTRWHA